MKARILAHVERLVGKLHVDQLVEVYAHNADDLNLESAVVEVRVDDFTPRSSGLLTMYPRGRDPEELSNPRTSHYVSAGARSHRALCPTMSLRVRGPEEHSVPRPINPQHFQWRGPGHAV